MGELIEYRIYDVDGKNHLSKKEFDKKYISKKKISQEYDISREDIYRVLTAHSRVSKTVQMLPDHIRLQAIERDKVGDFNFFGLDEIIEELGIVTDNGSLIREKPQAYFKATKTVDDTTHIALISVKRYFKQMQKEIWERQEGNDPNYGWLENNYLMLKAFGEEEDLDFNRVMGVLSAVIKSCNETARLRNNTFHIGPLEQYCAEISDGKEAEIYVFKKKKEPIRVEQLKAIWAKERKYKREETNAGDIKEDNDLVRQYLKSVGMIPLLLKEEEVLLSRGMEEFTLKYA